MSRIKLSQDELKANKKVRSAAYRVPRSESRKDQGRSAIYYATNVVSWYIDKRSS